MEEYFDLLDENGNMLGIKKLRKEVHRDGDWHKAVHIWIFNKDGEVLLQRRAPNKDCYPNMLDISCAGHLSAGDNSIQGALRELEEELGLIVLESDLTLFSSMKISRCFDSSFLNNEFNDIYYLITDKSVDEMKIQEEEISEIFFIKFNELKRRIEEKDESIAIEKFEFDILEKHIDEIKKEIDNMNKIK